MKTLEQLGISPAPWKPEDDGMGYKDIWCNAPVTEDSEGENIIAEAISKKDANMIAAAPDMYKTEYDLVDVIERLMNGWAGTCDVPSQDEVVAAIEAAKNALDKAAGESEARND